MHYTSWRSLSIFTSMITTSAISPSVGTTVPPPIVYTIAGSDSGGGAGVQADLHTIHCMNCHGCSVITCLTAQNSRGVSGVHSPPSSFIQAQFDALIQDLPPRAIKIGMLGSSEIAETVGRLLKKISRNQEEKPFVVLDPVMISTSGHRLIDDDAIQAIIQHVFPHADVITPNKFEAEVLLEKKLLTPDDVEKGAQDLLALGAGAKSVLIKGGHWLAEATTGDSQSPNVNRTLQFAQDYFLSRDDQGVEARLCDGNIGVWLRTKRFDSEHTHGTGCTLSSAIASALALGHQQRELAMGIGEREGATRRAISLTDACCLAKAYVTSGIARGVRLGQGPGPVVHTEFPSSYLYFPSITLDPDAVALERRFPLMRSIAGGMNSGSDTIGPVLPIVDSVEWVDRLAKIAGVTDIQLRVKDESTPELVLERVTKCQQICSSENVRLWVNDHWEAACKASCFGVHLGQEDLYKCYREGGLEEMMSQNIALGVSTHSYSELAAAIGIKPTYVSLGPIFQTSSKQVAFEPQGVGLVSKWRGLIPPDVPFVAIGGIQDAETARLVRNAGANCVAVIGAITQAEDVERAVSSLTNVMA